MVTLTQQQQAQAWRFEFTDVPPRRGEPPFTREPRAAWVSRHDEDAKTLLGDMAMGRWRRGGRSPQRFASSSARHSASGITIIFLAPGEGTSRAVQRQADDWMSPQFGDRGSMLEVHTSHGGFLWRPGRAVCFGTTRALEETLPGLVRFSFCEEELSGLEHQVQSCWSRMEKDVRQMRQLTKQDLARQPHIETMARTVTGMRMAYARLMSALETPNGELKGPDRRLFLELALQADALDRLKMLDDAIEVFEEFYRSEREQFAGFRYFVREYRVSALILVALVTQLIFADQPITAVVMDLVNWAYPIAMHMISSAIRLIHDVWLGPGT
jgi:hypothetical protein